MKNLKYILKEMKYFCVLICLFLLSIPLHTQPPSHDPCNMMRDGNRYWVFYTANGIGALSASDPEFSDWQSEPSVFGSTWPSWINSYVPAFAGQFWAPACIYMNNKYYLYYSCSTMGSSLSAIGVATSPSLNDPDWTDLGMVVNSDGSGSGTLNNAIDPAIFKDDDGRVWMTYGSWFGGITITEIDSITGKTIGGLTQLAGGNHQDIEASYLLKHDGYYYLFVNRAHCCNGVNSTYYIQVGRSTSVTGPYGDWRTFLQTDGRYIGPGHFGYGQDRLTYHIYDRSDNGASKLINTTLGWDDGWPIAGEISQDPPGAEFLDGTYRITPSDSNFVVGVSNNSPVVGGNVQLWEYTDTGITGQSWTITNTYLNKYKISPEDYSNLAFDVYNCVIDDGANIGLWSYWGGACQQWLFYKISDSLYQIRSVLSNKCIEIEGTSLTEGANIFQNSCDTSNQNQAFRLDLLEIADTSNNGDSYPAILSYSSQQIGNPATNLLDGNNEDDSRWSAEGFPQSVVIDFGENKSIIGTKVWTYQDRAYQFTIQLDDNDNFSSPYTIDRSSNTSSSQPISDNFNPVTARYAKLTVTGALGYTGTWVSITEFEIVEGTTGVKGIYDTDNINISFYPNPVENILNIALSEKLGNRAKLTIYNTIGQAVFSKNYVNGTAFSLDLSDLMSGIYNMVVVNDQLIHSKWFVKQ